MVMTGKPSAAILLEGIMDRNSLMGILLAVVSTSPLVVHFLQKMACLKVHSLRLFSLGLY